MCVCVRVCVEAQTGVHSRLPHPAEPGLCQPLRPSPSPARRIHDHVPRHGDPVPSYDASNPPASHVRLRSRRVGWLFVLSRWLLAPRRALSDGTAFRAPAFPWWLHINARGRARDLLQLTHPRFLHFILGLSACPLVANSRGGPAGMLLCTICLRLHAWLHGCVHGTYYQCTILFRRQPDSLEDRDALPLGQSSRSASERSLG